MAYCTDRCGLRHEVCNLVTPKINGPASSTAVEVTLFDSGVDSHCACFSCSDKKLSR
jgi:hypothetical protein